MGPHPDPNFISSSSIPSILTNRPTIHYHHSSKRTISTGGYLSVPGIEILPGTCAPAEAKQAVQALLWAQRLAIAGANAASEFNSLPFSALFGADIDTALAVGAILDRIIASLSDKGSSNIKISCYDFLGKCNKDPINARGPLAYAVPVEKLGGTLVFCPVGLRLPTNPEPQCSQPPGMITLGEMTLSQILHLDYIRGSQVLLQGPNTAASITASVRAGKSTLNLPNAYGLLGSWAFDLGYAYVALSAVVDAAQLCLQNFYRADFAAVVRVDDPIVTYCRTNADCGREYHCVALSVVKPAMFWGSDMGKIPANVGVCLSMHGGVAKVWS
ncbi:MAG: hypothetical protein M1827_003097 [Pycnora praestabilis]|nr:MAG: hypothetical protein M1827_003097 [Pycnora praestabilis]